MPKSKDWVEHFFTLTAGLNRTPVSVIPYFVNGKYEWSFLQVTIEGEQYSARIYHKNINGAFGTLVAAYTEDQAEPH